MRTTACVYFCSRALCALEKWMFVEYRLRGMVDILDVLILLFCVLSVRQREAGGKTGTFMSFFNVNTGLVNE
jgi:hypothetical protein